MGASPTSSSALRYALSIMLLLLTSVERRYRLANYKRLGGFLPNVRGRNEIVVVAGKLG